MSTQVQPNDPDSIIRRIREELRENPEARTLLLRDLLSENLLQLPVRLDILSETVAQNAIAIANLSDKFAELLATQRRTDETLAALAESQQRTDERFDRLAESQQRTDEAQAQSQQRTDAMLAALNESQRRADEQFERTDERLNRIAESQQRTDEAQAQSQQRTDAMLAALNESQQRVDEAMAQSRQRTDEAMAALSESQRRTEERFAQFMQSQQRMDNDIATLKGWGLELISRRRIPEFAKATGMRRLEEVPPAELRRIAEDACDYGHITEAEMDDVATADVVFYGRRRDSGAHAYLVAQASYSLHPSDITRAVEQAAVLAKITGIAAFPVVVGTHLTPEAATEIQRHDSVPYVHIVNGNRLRV